MTPTLALALEDFVPVLFTLLALGWIGRMVFVMDRRSGYVAVLGLVFVVLGGLLKATSKVVWVTAGAPVAWMEDALFLLMAPGFAFLAWAMWCAQRTQFQDIQPRFVWQTPMILLLFIGGGTGYANSADQERTWFFVLLTLVVVMSALMLIFLSRHAWYHRKKGIAFLFMLYLTLNLVLNGMARTPSPTLGVEWTKQLLNTVATGILAFASWRLWLVTR